jgi:hypothetical protein
MSRRPATVPCAVCREETPSSKLCRVVIEGRTIPLCREHAALVASRMPRSFEDLRDLFREAPGDGEHARRSKLERRGFDDRRIFPPRPEGRRMEGGRRATDAPGS